MADNVVLNTGAGGDTIAADDVSGVKFQRNKLVHGADGANDGDVSNANPLPIKVPSASRSDAYTAAANGTAVDVSARPTRSYAMQVKGTGAAPTAFNVVLEASLDNANWTTVLTMTEADGDGAVRFTGGLFFPALYFRSRCVTVTLGSATDIVATILGVG